jgi:hypothetical protein
MDAILRSTVFDQQKQQFILLSQGDLPPPIGTQPDGRQDD